jgi:hypothetical protein
MGGLLFDYAERKRGRACLLDLAPVGVGISVTIGK